jgi:antitoxin MazE
MQSRVQKWGNSLALRIPKSFATEIGLVDDAPVEIVLEGGKLVIIPIQAPVYSLEKLLADVTPENIHVEQSTGSIEGKEIW